jgi:hypothetical protein
VATVSNVSATYLLASAVQRASDLLKILDRQHTVPDLYRQLAGVRHEVETMRRFLPEGAKPANRSTGGRRALGTRPDSHRHRIMLVLEVPGVEWTAPTVAKFMSIKVGVVRARLVEMVAADWIQAYGFTADPSTNRNNTVWILTDKGRAALKKLESHQLVLVEV